MAEYMLRNIRQCSLKPPVNSIILSNGSERGPYVPCEKVHWKIGRIHDGIQLMKTYYPSDPKWDVSRKVSEARNNESVSFQWNFDYDDYDPYDLLEMASKTRLQMEQIKQAGADIHLCITLDMSLNDDELRQIFLPLANFGRIYLRINHEANGYWFRHNTQHTYKEAADFFVRCHHIAKSVTSHILTVFSLSADVFVGDSINSVVSEQGAHLSKAELYNALSIADFWSIDKYVALNWGWPHSHPSSSGDYFEGTVDTWWRLVEETYLHMIYMNDGRLKPLFIHEFNVDSDVVGQERQAEIIQQVYERIRRSRFPWLKGICMYQFCDRGGLGLVTGEEHDNVETPALAAYRTAIHDMDYEYLVDSEEWPRQDYSFFWMDIDSVRGLSITLAEEAKVFTNRLSMPVYMSFGSSWHYVRPNTKIEIPDCEARMFIPPSKKAHSMKINYVHKVKDIKNTLMSMID